MGLRLEGMYLLEASHTGKDTMQLVMQAFFKNHGTRTLLLLRTSGTNMKENVAAKIKCKTTDVV